MAARPTDRPVIQPALRKFSGKTVRVQVLLRPAEAEKLRLVAAGLRLDLGDVVTVGLLPVLARVRAHVAVNEAPAATEVNGESDMGPELRVAS